MTIIEDSMKATINQLKTDYRAMEVLYKTTIQRIIKQADRIEALQAIVVDLNHENVGLKQTIARLKAGQGKVATE